jgi:hypothetical protein
LCFKGKQKLICGALSILFFLGGIFVSNISIAEEVKPLVTDPDFTVYCIYSPTSFTAGQEFVVGARVRNTSDVGTSKGVYAYLYIDGVLSVQLQPAVDTIGSF